MVGRVAMEWVWVGAAFCRICTCPDGPVHTAHSIAETQPHYHTTPTTLSRYTNHIITLHQPHYHTTPTTLSRYTNHIITLHQPHYHTTPTTLSHYTNTNHLSHRTPALTTLSTPQKHNHTTPTTSAREHLPQWPCTHHRNTTTLHQPH